MRNKKWIIGIVVVVVIVVVTLIILPRVLGFNPQAPLKDKVESTPLISGQVITVSVDEVKIQHIEETLFTIGSIDPLETFNVTAKVNGDVKATYFEIGDVVKKGDVLFEIDQSSYDTTRLSTLNQLSNGVKQATLSLEQAQKNYEDQMRLLESGATSETAVANAKSVLDNAQIGYNNASSNYSSNTSSLNTQLENYIQKSPVDGVVVEKNISKDMFGSSQSGYTIIPENAFIVNASISSKYVNQLKKGQKAMIYVNTLEKSYEGELISISTIGQKGAYPLEISINGDESLMSGLYAEVNIITSVEDQALTIAKNAILTEEQQSYVYKVIGEQQVEKVFVKLGIENHEFVQVLSGLYFGDQVVTLGKEFVSEDTKIMIK